jgi:hypothetical protein
MKARKKSMRTKTPAKKIAKKTTRRYNAQTGELSGREIKAMKRLKALTEEYIAEGMDPGSARQKGFSPYAR